LEEQRLCRVKQLEMGYATSEHRRNVLSMTDEKLRQAGVEGVEGTVLGYDRLLDQVA
jgi:hypothetical protein